MKKKNTEKFYKTFFRKLKENDIEAMEYASKFSTNPRIRKKAWDSANQDFWTMDQQDNMIHSVVQSIKFERSKNKNQKYKNTRYKNSRFSPIEIVNYSGRRY